MQASSLSFRRLCASSFSTAASIPRIQYLLDGVLRTSSGSTTFPVVDPSTGETVAATPQCTASELEACAASSEKAFLAWSRLPPQQRARINFKLSQLIRERTEQLAGMITREQGKTLGDARGDVFRGLEVSSLSLSLSPHSGCWVCIPNTGGRGYS